RDTAPSAACSTSAVYGGTWPNTVCEKLIFSSIRNGTRKNSDSHSIGRLVTRKRPRRGRNSRPTRRNQPNRFRTTSNQKPHTPEADAALMHGSSCRQHHGAGRLPGQPQGVVPVVMRLGTARHVGFLDPDDRAGRGLDPVDRHIAQV